MLGHSAIGELALGEIPASVVVIAIQVEDGILLVITDDGQAELVDVPPVEATLPDSVLLKIASGSLRVYVREI